MADKTSKRPYPLNLASKLLQVRQALGLSQNGMLKKLRVDVSCDRSTISGYERGEREPPLPVLLKYAEAANICLDFLVDDEAKLPAELPAKRRNRHG